MELSQSKLTKQEWDNLEIPVQGKEKDIINFIHNSIYDLLRSISKATTLMEFMKINDDNFHEYLYNKYYKKQINKLNNKYGISFVFKESKKFKIKRIDILKINNYDKKITNKDIYEDVLLYNIKKMLKSIKNPDKFNYYYYTISRLIVYKINKINKYVLMYIRQLLNIYASTLNIKNLLKNSYKIIEKNPLLFKYKNIKLYKHQHDIIELFMQQSYNEDNGSNKEGMLMLYQAPTATGKTMTPLALVKIKKIIFVCTARHVGLQLAKCCISLQIPIAVAFNCKSEDDIRLHYYAAMDYSRNYKTGGIWKVDNSVGHKVEIIISDIQSYLYAMDYMCTFNDKEDIIWYWDEPTITLDYTEHPFHKILEKNWKNNIIPNIVLSSATLPNMDEIPHVINYYKQKFNSNNIHTIKSYEFNKTVPIINKDGYLTLPHTLLDNAIDLKKSIKIINKNKTFLRHMDIKEITKFIIYVNENIALPKQYTLDIYFDNIDKLTILNIKLYYLDIINILIKDEFIHEYENIYNHFKQNNKCKYESTIKITTSDSHTLTDGPTIFLTDNVDKLSSFYLNVSNIPENEINNILDIINKNRKYVNELDKIINNEQQRLDKKDDKILDRDEKGKEYDIKRKYREQVNSLRSKIDTIGLKEYYIPNKKLHMKKWVNEIYTNVFTSNIHEKYIEEIVTLNIKAKWKILLFMGIGVFMNDLNKDYMEIMKKLAYEQKLYLIIASPDYIYGTNYQFCHGYLGKEFNNMSREKIIQAMGRVGRHSTDLEYTIRIRDDNIIKKLFLNDTDKPEIDNMNKLFGI